MKARGASPLATVAVLAACAHRGSPSYVCGPGDTDPVCPRLANASRALPWRLVTVLDHDPSAFTEGLTFAGGRLFESSGQPHDSWISELDPTTGRAVRTRRWRFHRKVCGGPRFAEGLAYDGTRLVQLSWKSGTAVTWDPGGLKQGGHYSYRGQGWGLCFDGAQFIRSDGSSQLHAHALGSFASGRSWSVSLDGAAIADLNELECVGEHVYANVWHTKYVVRIERASGLVDGVLDLSDIVSREDVRGSENVLNGLAWDADQSRLYVTGKRWKHMYVLELL